MSPEHRRGGVSRLPQLSRKAFPCPDLAGEPTLPYEPALIAVEWVRCTVCRVRLARGDCPGHDEWHAWLADALARDPGPVPELELAS